MAGIAREESEIVGEKRVVQRGIVRGWVALLVATLVLGAVSCGGDVSQEAAAPEPAGKEPLAPIVVAENAEVGKVVRSEEWAIVLEGQPEQTKIVGTGEDVDSSSFRHSSDPGLGQRGNEEAEGVWIVLPVEITNESGDLAMLSKRQFAVVDDKGGEYPVGETTVLFVTILGSGGRWETVQEHQLIQFVFESGDTRTGPLVFDVPEDATGLKLMMEGSEEAIDLGS